MREYLPMEFREKMILMKKDNEALRERVMILDLSLTKMKEENLTLEKLVGDLQAEIRHLEHKAGSLTLGAPIEIH